MVSGIDTYSVAVKLAGMLLLHDGEITVGEIESLPFVNNRQEAIAIAQKLAKAFESDYQVEVSSGLGQSGARLRLVAGASDTAKTARQR